MFLLMFFLNNTTKIKPSSIKKEVDKRRILEIRLPPYPPNQAQMLLLPSWFCGNGLCAPIHSPAYGNVALSLSMWVNSVCLKDHTWALHLTCALQMFEWIICLHMSVGKQLTESVNRWLF